MENPRDEIRKELKSGKLIIGTERTLKRLRAGKLKKIYVSANCPSSVKEDITTYSDISSVEVIKLKQQNDELGVICRKPYFISVLGLEE